jgi:hypothetical protein
MTEVIGLLIVPLLIMMMFILVSERFVAALGSIAEAVRSLMP